MPGRLFVFCLLVSATARAQGELPVDFRSQEVWVDPKAHAIHAEGDVVVNVPPFVVRSPELTLSRERLGVRLVGEGRLAFCPCLGEPLALRFREATVAPPADVLVRGAVFELYRVPFLYLPVFWLRSAKRPGLLPPEFAYRGGDGLLLGVGAHLPGNGHTKERPHALDVRGGGYLQGGFRTELRLSTPGSSTNVVVDHLGTLGWGVDARGSAGPWNWDADLLRGGRAIKSTTDLDAAARVYDRASAEWSSGLGGVSVASAFRIVTPRGGHDLAFAGPWVTLHRSTVLGTLGLLETSLGGGGFRRPEGDLSLARANVAFEMAGPVSVFEPRASVRAAMDGAAEAARSASLAQATTRLHVGLPLVRAFGGEEPWVHRVTPFVEGAAIAMGGRGDARWMNDVGVSNPLSPAHASLAELGVRSSLGSPSRETAWELEAASGGLSREAGEDWGGRARTSLSARAFAWGADVAGLARDRAGALSLRTRILPKTWPHLLLLLESRRGVDTALARMLLHAEEMRMFSYLDRDGSTGSTHVEIPWTTRLSTRGGGWVDVEKRTLLAASFAIDFHDPCGCMHLRLSGSRRIGREGVDVWLTVDLMTERR